MSNKNLKIKKNYLVGLLSIGAIIAIMIFVSPKNDVDTNIKLNTNIANNNSKTIFNTETYTFSGGIFELDVVSYDDNTQKLKIKNLKDETIIYFISKINEWDYITLLYIDASDNDPYSLTEIVYTDIENVLNVSAELVFVENGILTLLVGDIKYILDSALGVDAQPILVEDT